MKTADKLGCLFWFIVVLILGFFAVRQLINEKTKIEYERQETVSGSVIHNQLVPVSEEIPESPNLPVRIDTVYKDKIKYIVQKVDTAAIIADYMLKRNYNLTAFDNKELGTLKLFPTIQYNQLAGLDYEFTPVQRQIKTYKETVWQLFLSGSYSTSNHIYLGGGLFYHNLGFEYQYQMDITGNNNGHSFGLKYKF